MDRLVIIRRGFMDRLMVIRGRLMNWLVNRLIDRFMNWLMNWLIDRLVDRLVVIRVVLSVRAMRLRSLRKWSLAANDFSGVGILLALWLRLVNFSAGDMTSVGILNAFMQLVRADLLLSVRIN